MRSIHIKASREYDVLVERGLLDRAGELLREVSAPGMAAIVSDDTVYALYGERTVKALEKAGYRVHSFTFPAGEGSKNLSTYADVLHFLGEHRFSRSDVVVALGGGVVGDLAGFAAATYQRGMGFAQIPTTLLAAVDSSVGGKTGVNIPEGKNLVGAFHQPKAVYTDSAFLKSLPKRQFAAGMAEVVKCAVLGDAELFGRLAARGKPMEFDSPELGDAVVSSCKLKAKIVAEDERETSPNGGRALLNLGHTFGHAIERNAGYGKYLHGEAVSIGTVMAAVLSRRLGLIGDAQVEAIARLLRSEGLPVSLAERISADDFIDAMHGDKKALAGALRFVTILDIGKTRTETVPDALVRDAIADFYKR